MKKLFSATLILAVMLAACSSSNSDTDNSPTEHPNQTLLNPPESQQYDQSRVYIDSVSIVEQGLLISGNLPDGCSKLHEVSHSLQNDSLSISLSAWKPADKMCTQAVTPFSFTYKKIGRDQLQNAAVISVNKKYESNR